ncbi:AAA family ATPase, partial [Streptomyces sp. PU-14G]|uniref:ATP-binding protein n=1 Tax=Streptomyces sp. PU-14G TaxID=2800808 RepID=UPI0034E053B7
MLNTVPLTTTVSPVFVGRAAELAALTEALARAEAGTPQALLLGGEAGVGKTRLLEEFLERVRALGGTTTLGGCLELGAEGLPFAPFTTALRGLRRAVGPARLASAAEGREAELARLLPDLAVPAPAAAQREEYADLSDGADGGRALLFEATAQLLERLAADRTLVVALEDLQWADRSTRELVGYLFRSTRACRLVLLATYRSDDVHRRHPLRPFLAEQDRLRTVLHLALPRLTRAEVRAQITGINGTEPDSELAEEVFRRSEGIPFFVEELTATRATCAISDSLRDLLLVRVEALPEAAQRVVRLAAGGGSAVEHALLAAVAGLGEEALLDALRAAVGGNVLRATDDGSGYHFRHALLREAVREDLLPGELARVNRRYAETLEADPSLVRAEERPARLAHYWHRGRDAAKALPAALSASVDARSRHAYAEEHHLLERVIELWDDVPEDVRKGLPGLTLPRTFPADREPGATAIPS